MNIIVKEIIKNKNKFFIILKVFFSNKYLKKKENKIWKLIIEILYRGKIKNIEINAVKKHVSKNK